MTKTILVVLLMSLATVTMGLSIEEQVQAKSIIGNTSDGYEEGKDQGYMIQQVATVIIHNVLQMTA